MPLTIVTISKNDPIGLKRTLDSLHGVDNIEKIIVVSDSTGESQSFLTHYSGQVFEDEGQGISQAFNLGLSHGTGEAILFLNGGDVLLEPAFIAASLKRLVQQPEIDILTYDAIFDSPLIGPYLYKTASLSCTKPLRIGLGMPCSHQAMVVRRSCFERTGAFKVRYTVAMDYEWLCRWFKRYSQQFCLCSVEFPPVVCVDGTGLSIQQEPYCLRECLRALLENQLLFSLAGVDYANRLIRFLLRYGLTRLGFNQVVAWVKSSMHSPIG